MSEVNWERGLNFGRARYHIINTGTFIPYIHSDQKATIPIEILKNFVDQKSSDLIALLKITDRTTGRNAVRIKKLCRNGQSLAFSLEKERNTKEPVVEVLDIKSEQECLSRLNEEFLDLSENIPTLYVLPSYTLSRSFPYQTYQKVAALFVFGHQDNLYCETCYGWKNIITKKGIMPDELMAAVIGLYFAEGGKTAASFTNSQPIMINTMLDFIEETTNVRRSDVSASIYCHPNLVGKKRNLENFWSLETGITKFSSNLHLSEKSTSPCGTLELKFSSVILKEFLCGLAKMVYNKPFVVEAKSVIRGIFSAEASPTKQTKTCLTHHITLDRHNWNIQFDFINVFASRLGIKLATVPTNPSCDSRQVHAVANADWMTNLKMLLLDVYLYNLFNRKKFARQFLSLPKTKLFLELEESDVITGREIVKGKRISDFKKWGLITPEQISPKPNKKYEIRFTEEGLELKETLRNFISNVYPGYEANVKKFYKTLENFRLFGEEK
jgi:hypothetical protein